MLNRYAAAPQELRIDWEKFTKDYFLNRPTLVSVFLLIDASIPAKKIDLELAGCESGNILSCNFLLESGKM
jgi:GTP-binding protein